jgi:hypothetical protein
MLTILINVKMIKEASSQLMATTITRTPPQKAKAIFPVQKGLHTNTA